MFCYGHDQEQVSSHGRIDHAHQVGGRTGGGVCGARRVLVADERFHGVQRAVEVLARMAHDSRRSGSTPARRPHRRTPGGTNSRSVPRSPSILRRSRGGTLKSIATGLKVPAGTYSQLRLIPLDASAALAASASAAGAKYNAEADYTDPSGNAQQAPLELLNPDKGIGVSTTLTVKASLAQLGSLTTTGTSTCLAGETTACTPATTAGDSCTSGEVDCMSPSGTACAVGETGCTTTAATTTPAPATSSAAAMSVAVTVDGIHDLVQFAYGDPNNQQIGVLLNPHPSAYDVSTAGTLRGTVELRTRHCRHERAVRRASHSRDTQRDGSRHVAVKTVQVASDGSFVLYPLPHGRPDDHRPGTTSLELDHHLRPGDPRAPHRDRDHQIGPGRRRRPFQQRRGVRWDLHAGQASRLHFQSGGGLAGAARRSAGGLYQTFPVRERSRTWSTRFPSTPSHAFSERRGGTDRHRRVGDLLEWRRFADHGDTQRGSTPPIE